ncbi:hypothetical protein B0H19DRAFT_1175768 [Mycena capillaripes]|nr:hypothetical protein B0H19DRAFT_1175768 [Mycena capillaripes]
MGQKLSRLGTTLLKLGQVNISPRASFVPNPFPYTFVPSPCLGATCTMFIVARSFASFTQTVQMTVPGANCMVLGTGEDVAMTTTGTPSGSQSCSFGGGTSITFSFTSSGPGLPVVLTPTVSPSPFPNAVEVGIVSEDSADNDNNDTFLTMTLIASSFLSAAAVPSSTDITLVSVLGLQTFAKQGGLTAHANIKYSSGLTSDIDLAVGAFSEAFTLNDFVVTGVIADDKSTASRFNFVTLNFYFTDSKLAGMKGATLALRGFLKYSKNEARPTGSQFVSWIGTLDGSSVTVVSTV